MDRQGKRRPRPAPDSYDEELEMEIEDRHHGSTRAAGKEPKQFPYREMNRAPSVLPEHEHHEHYSRQAVPPEMLVPEVY